MDTGTLLTVVFTGLTAVATGGIAYGGIKLWQTTERAAQAADRALIRQQAESIDLSFDVFDQSDPNDEDAEDEVHMALVANKSRRPIREVSCSITDGVREGVPARAGRRVFHRAIGNHQIYSAENATIELIRPAEEHAFIFPWRVTDSPNVRMSVTFTDDAKKKWRIDHDLNLEPLPEEPA